MGSLMEMNQRVSLSTGHAVLGAKSMDRLKTIFTAMDVDGDKKLSWEEFDKGILAHSEIRRFLRKQDTQSRASLFRFFDRKGKGLLSMNDFVVGIVKRARGVESIDMLDVDRQLRETRKTLKTIKLIYETDTKLMRNYMVEIDAKLIKLSEDTGVLREDMDKLGGRDVGAYRNAAAKMKSGVHDVSMPLFSPKDSARHFGIDGSGMGQLEGHGMQRVLRKLQAKFEFQSRMEKLEALVAKGTAEASERTAARQAASGEAVVWRDMLFRDVLPWLRHELATLPDRLEAPLTQLTSHSGRILASRVPASARSYSSSPRVQS